VVKQGSLITVSLLPIVQRKVQMRYLQSSEATVDASVVDIESYTKVLVYVSCRTKLKVGFVDCVEEICHNH
jgi:hypothetical protein